MMIKFATDKTAPLVRKIWETCFGNVGNYNNIYFAHKYQNNNTLLLFENDIAVASLQILNYTLNYYNTNIPLAYLSGICTLPKYREKGYASKLINEAHKLINYRNIPLAALIPQEDRLYEFYNKFDYEKVFEKDNIIIPLKEIIDTSASLPEAYQKFDSLFRHQHFCIQKTFEDFVAIIEEFKNDHYKEKTNLSGMAKIIDAERLLRIYAENNSEKQFKININDELTSKKSTYYINNGLIETLQDSCSDIDFEVSMRTLCRLLFGFKTKESEFEAFFPEKKTTMNCMLE